LIREKGVREKRFRVFRFSGKIPFGNYDSGKIPVTGTGNRSVNFWNIENSAPGVWCKELVAAEIFLPPFFKLFFSFLFIIDYSNFWL